MNPMNDVGCKSVVVVAVVLVLLMVSLLPSAVVCYRLEDSMEDDLGDFRDLFDKNDQATETTDQDERVWKHKLPLLVNLLKSIEDWEKDRSTEEGSSRSGSSRSRSRSRSEERPIHQSKRARENVYGAMPPLGELCRMMGYASCPH